MEPPKHWSSGRGIRILFAVAVFASMPALADPPDLTVSPSNPTLIKGLSLNFQALLESEHEDKRPDVKSWTSSNPAVASIDGSGHAVALSAGSTTISAVVGNRKGTATLTVITVANPIFSVQPGTTRVSEEIRPEVKVLIRDNRGLPIDGLRVTMSIGTNAGQGGAGVLRGTLNHATHESGIASFEDLSIDWLGTGYTLVATVDTPTGPLSSTSARFDETRVGDPCLGPIPACSSGCRDSDNDGLNDAWEIAGGIDMNGDGKIDARHDVLLPDANPHKPDVYVKYDYMVAPTHSHQPSQAALDQVIAAFAAHGVNLHFAAPSAGITETVVTTLDPAPTLACAGTSVSTMESLRAAYFGNRQPAYHYMVFAHRATTPDLTHQAACPSDPTTGIKPDPAATGRADIAGDDAIISFGAYFDAGLPVGIETMASTIMHELGHNFGLLHGGPDSINHKPNYLSVMNYSYQLNGILVAVAPGSTNFRTCAVERDCGPPAISTGECVTPNACHCTDDLAAVLGTEVCYRVDYSGRALPSLNELSPSPGVGGLDETVGISGPSTDEDLVVYYVPGPAVLFGVSNGGAIDWNNDGAIGTHVSADINNDGSKSFLTTQNDWETSGGLFTKLNFRFQCTALFGSPSSQIVNETHGMSRDYAMEHHLLYPPATVSLLLNLACSNSSVAPVPPGTVQMALLGSARFDVNQVEPSSLSFHGARPTNISVQDANNDGIPDLVLQFRAPEVRLSPSATRVRLTGWLKNSRAFTGETELSSGCPR